MASKTRVDGNRVIIDDLVYTVVSTGNEYYSVHDQFGEELGYLRIRGKTITPDDFGVDGAPPLMQIGRLWLTANGPAEKRGPPPSKGVCHVAHHEGATDEELEAARTYRAWLKKQPGIKASYLARDPATGKAMTVSFWQTAAHLEAAQKATDAEGAALKATTTETFPYLEEP